MNSTPSLRQPKLQCEQLEDRLALDATSYVKSLYVNVLGRQADTGGLNFWVNQIQVHGMTNLQVAIDFWQSVEHRADQVTSYYQHYLHRNPDSAGLNFFVNEMESGALNEQGVQAIFFTSNEYLAAHNTPQTYVEGLYLDILGRLPSGSEESNWEMALQQFGDAAVTASILTSTEKYVDTITTFYQRYLNRTPDSSGLDFWLTSLQNGQATIEAVAVGILGSAEYANDH
jgi:type III secretory pathway component EscR